ncbi:MAG TPA: hypothetical protein VGD65_01890 [Chryseosolibacter sp.]
MEALVKNKLVDVNYDRGRKLLIYEWHGIANADIGIETFKTTIEFIRKNPCYFVLHDASKMTGTFTKMSDFMSKEVAPNFEKHGGLRSAMVLSTDVFSIYAINHYLKLVKTSKAELKLFKTRELAMSWLEQMMVKDPVT